MMTKGSRDRAAAKFALPKVNKEENINQISPKDTDSG